MKLKFLRSLWVVFACVIGTGAVFADEVTCDAAHYLSNGTCVNCPDATHYLSNGTCVNCPAETPYNMGGYCGACTEAGFYVTENDACETCPAGYYCPGTDNPNTNSQAIICPENTYSEGGASECTHCPIGYSTASSGPVDFDYDGLCLERHQAGAFGIGCMYAEACKLTKSGLSVARDSDWLLFYLGNNIKVESLNKSVVKIIEGYNPATTQTARPDIWFDDDE